MMGKQKLLRWIGSVPVVMMLLVMIVAPEKTVGASPNLQSAGYVISASLPYVWLRSQPSSSASVITTIYPGQVFQVNGPSAWDGVQSWAHVYLYSSGLSGWVEMNAIVAVNSAPYVPPTTVGGAAAWNTSTRVVVSSNVPFAYLRASPSSFAAVVSAVPSGTILSIASNSPQWDGTQWWWLVRRDGSNATGWVEQVSLQVTSAFRGRVPFQFPFPFPFPFRARQPRRY